jgi:acyl carrier protein
VSSKAGQVGQLYLTLQERTFMETTDIFEKLNSVFNDIFDEDSLELTPQLTAKDIEGWDSLTHIRLILTVEKEFDVKFSTAELSQFENVGQLVDMINGKLST